jgi:lysophospholipase L1-like esterase
MRLVAIGDSTVEGLEDLAPDGSYRGWADRFAQHLAARHPGLLYANLAVRGQTTAEVRATQLAPAVALRPDVAVVVAGVNDVLRPRLDPVVLRDNLLTMHRELAAAGARVVTFTMPDMARVAPLAVALRSRLRLLNELTAEVAALHGGTLVDLAAEPVASHPALWHTDRLHANAEGHRRIGLALAEAFGCDVEGWRDEPPAPARRTRVRVVYDEMAWAAGHLVPWAWRHARGKSSGDERTCKRPELLPVV